MNKKHSTYLIALCFIIGMLGYLLYVQTLPKYTLITIFARMDNGKELGEVTTSVQFSNLKSCLTYAKFLQDFSDKNVQYPTENKKYTPYLFVEQSVCINGQTGEYKIR